MTERKNRVKKLSKKNAKNIVFLDFFAFDSLLGFYF